MEWSRCALCLARQGAQVGVSRAGAAVCCPETADLLGRGVLLCGQADGMPGVVHDWARLAQADAGAAGEREHVEAIEKNP